MCWLTIQRNIAKIKAKEHKSKRDSNREGAEEVGQETGNKVNQKTYSVLTRSQGEKGKGIHLASSHLLILSNTDP